MQAKKGVIVKNVESSKKRKFAHCLVVGLQKPPKTVKKRRNKKSKRRANSIRPFAKYVNVRHLMPTRYSIDNQTDLDPTRLCLDEQGERSKRDKAKDWDDQERETRKESLKAVKKAFEARWNEGLPKPKKQRWFFDKLRF